MGTDDLHKKRKARTASSLKRKKESREPYDKVLIVCEGEKTEPFYLTSLRDFLKLSQANVKVDPDCDSSPTSVVNYAKELISKAKKEDPYNYVFCVIDRDTHKDFDKAAAQVESFKAQGTKLILIVSDPCFEYWVLLHYFYTTKTFGVSGSSPCEDLIKYELKKFIIDYEKGDSSIMKELVENMLDRAVAHAKKAKEELKRSGTNAPKTDMDILVEYLKGLKSK